MALAIRSLSEAEAPLPAPLTKQRVADLIVDTLHELGIDTFYGIPGGAIASVYDAMVERPHLRVVNARHETGAVYMAMGQSRVGGSMPCVLVTSGPGITNALTGLAAAQADGIPLICIAGEVPRRNFGRGALQEGSRYQLDVLGMVRSVTKFAAELSNPRGAATLVRKAVATALSGRQGPVFLSLPLDIANEEVTPVKTFTRVSTSFDVDDEAITQAADALQNSERAVIVAGSGARHPEAVRWIGTLASTLGIPVVTTPKAKGLFPESDPLALGVFGYGGHPSAAAYLESGVDVLLCVGCGLGETGTNSWSSALQPAKTFIQIDIDAAQIGKNYHVDLGLVGPSHLVLRSIATKIRRRPRPVQFARKSLVDADVAEVDSYPLKPARALRLLQQFSGERTIFTADVGEHAIFAIHYLQIDDPDAFIVNFGLGAMGSGIGAAVGAKLARPHRRVVSVCGDYGFQMHGMELATCVQEGIGVIYAVFNDARMRMVESGMTRIFGRTRPMHSQRVDFAALARSVGARGFNIREGKDFASLPADLGVDGVPVVLDIEVDPDAAFSVNGRVAQIKSFTGE